MRAEKKAEFLAATAALREPMDAIIWGDYHQSVKLAEIERLARIICIEYRYTYETHDRSMAALAELNK